MAMFKEVTSSKIQDGTGQGVKMINLLKQLTEVSKAIDFLGQHSKTLVEPRKPHPNQRGKCGLGRRNDVCDAFVV